MHTEPTIHIVDDDPAVRNALDFLLRANGFKTRLHACAQEFLDTLPSPLDGCLLLDVRMPGMDGMELQRWLAAQGIGIPVILMTGHGDVQMAVSAMKNGATDFIEKPFDNAALLERIRRCLADNEQRRLDTAGQTRAREKIANLTQREREIMEMLLAGHPNKIIAARLDISVRTAEAHRARIMEKLHVKSLPEIMRIALLASGNSE